MEQKKIATAVDIMIKTASYEYVHITKYSEKSIAYGNKEDMVTLEDEHSKELVNDIVRTLRAIPDQLGKSTLVVVNEDAEEKIKKRIPEWLENGPEPNIANTAKINHEETVTKINAEANDKKERSKEEDSIVEDLFDDKDSKEVKEDISKTEESKSEEPKTTPKTDDFGTDDLSDIGEDLFK